MDLARKNKVPASLDQKQGQVTLAPVLSRIQYLRLGYILRAATTSAAATTTTAQRRQRTHRRGHVVAALSYRGENRNRALGWLFAVRAVSPRGVHRLQLLEFMVTSGADIFVQRHDATSLFKSFGQTRHSPVGFELNLTEANMKSQEQHHH